MTGMEKQEREGVLRNTNPQHPRSSETTPPKLFNRINPVKREINPEIDSNANKIKKKRNKNSITSSPGNYRQHLISEFAVDSSNIKGQPKNDVVPSQTSGESSKIFEVQSGMTRESQISTLEFDSSDPLKITEAKLSTSKNNSSSLKQNQMKNEIILSEEQMNIIKIILEDGDNIFYTGAAGTGKSVLTREIIKRLRSKYKAPGKIAITAPTGLTALNIGGQTLHKFVGCGLAKESVKFLVKRIKKNWQAKQRWLSCAVLIIDEISMCDGDFLEKISDIAKAIRGNKNAFGGIQVIFTGNFFQLPPIASNQNDVKFAFESNCWKESISKSFELTTVFRQQGDNTFANMLNALRRGNITSKLEQQFKSLSREVKYENNLKPIELYPLRTEVDRANESKLKALAGSTMVYEARDGGTGDSYIKKDFFSNTIAPEILKLKIGCQVMVIKNLENGLANGSVGEVKAFIPKFLWKIISELSSDQDEKLEIWQKTLIFRKYEPSLLSEKLSTLPLTQCQLVNVLLRELSEHSSPSFPLVEFKDNGIHLIKNESFRLEDDENRILASRDQLPLNLSWALSIHKSQGQTLKMVKVNVGRVFESGQIYVALSRAISQDSLQVLNFKKEKIRLNPKVVEFYKNLSTS